MKVQVKILQYAVIATTIFSVSSPVAASLIQSKVLAFNQSSQGFGDSTGVHEHALSTAFYYQTYPDGGFYRGQTVTGFGWASGSASSRIVDGGIRLFSTFTIDDIVISYTGNQTAETHVPGEHHITYHANFAPHLNGNSTFSLGAQGSGFSYTGKTLYADGQEPLSGVWDIKGLYAVGTNLTLTIFSELSIANQLPEVQSAVRSSYGGFATVLGGSPVFILPEFYSANSADGSIVDNMYVGFNPLASDVHNSVSVPEPGTLCVFATGLLGLLINRRRTQSRG
ncbi:PEP-CTERM sorting domain-containing protein [Paraglaciecola aquimarina]|uniref:PEP-CTERM sorting domain-containing protein n=1 Tax=Paraglaciecola algarum TaxID=3050085 RepID=A0ABS9D6H9_9ALTE|nr:PEP-CTERM sorting domain-containing protein [Paraglaciecola sp. G1-23]MCF2948032.1 PEP-CTERM sorting domain-containing protein [Paraglaciecola sp. G1-23]